VWLAHCPLLLGFLLEMRSLIHCMEIRRKRPFDVEGVDWGACLEQIADGTYRIRTNIHGCIQDTERFLANFPWMTTIEAAIFAHAWKLGEQWHAGEAVHTGTLDNPAKACE